MLRLQERVQHRPLFNDASGLQHCDVAADFLDHRDFMRDQDDRHAERLVDVAEQGEDRRRRLRIERGRGFIAQQNLGLRRQRPGNADTLLLSAGQFRRIAVTLVGKADEFQQRTDALLDLGARAAGDFQRQRHVVEHGAHGQQIEVLEDHSDLAADTDQFALRQAGDVGAVDNDPSRRRLFQAVDEADECGLAGAGAADDAEHITAGDIEGHSVQRADVVCLLAAEDLGNGLEANDRFSRLHGYRVAKLGHLKRSVHIQ